MIKYVQPLFLLFYKYNIFSRLFFIHLFANLCFLLLQYFITFRKHR